MKLECPTVLAVLFACVGVTHVAAEETAGRVFSLEKPPIIHQSDADDSIEFPSGATADVQSLVLPMPVDDEDAMPSVALD